MTLFTFNSLNTGEKQSDYMLYIKEHIQIQIDMLCGQYGTGLQRGESIHITYSGQCEKIVLNTSKETKSKLF